MENLFSEKLRCICALCAFSKLIEIMFYISSLLDEKFSLNLNAFHLQFFVSDLGMNGNALHKRCSFNFESQKVSHFHFFFLFSFLFLIHNAIIFSSLKLKFMIRMKKYHLWSIAMFCVLFSRQFLFNRAQ